MSLVLCVAAWLRFGFLVFVLLVLFVQYSGYMWRGSVVGIVDSSADSKESVLRSVTVWMSLAERSYIRPCRLR